jgi:predicted Zn-dependent protease
LKVFEDEAVIHTMVKPFCGSCRLGLLLSLGLVLFQSSLAAQVRPPLEITPELDKLLNTALAEMYRYELDSADQKFDELVRQFPDHPIGYMHKAEVVWWRALRDNKNRSLQSTFERYTEEAISKGDRLTKQNPKEFYAFLYTAGAYGNRTRYHVYITRKYYPAMRAGMRGYDYIKSAYKLRNSYVDCLIGIGAYNYFAGALPAVIKIFAWMFAEGGDKDKGIEQLQAAAQKGEYGQTAAKMVLLGAFYNEKRFDEYRHLLISLIEQFPTNPVFITWLADFYQRQNKPAEGVASLNDLLHQSNNDIRGALATAQLQFEKARLELEKRALDDSISSLGAIINSKLQDAPLQARALLLRAFAWDLKGNRDSALSDYRNVLRLPDVDDSHKSAKQFLRSPYRGSLR